MANVLNIVYGSTTVNLTANGIDVLDPGYDPTWRDGVDEITESMHLKITGTSKDNLTAKIAAVGLAISQVARWRNERVGDRVYLSLQPDGYAAAWASEVLKADFYPAAGTLCSRTFKEEHVAVYVFTFTRRNYWQGAKTQLAITNPNGTANTTGLRVYNCSDEAVADTSYQRVNWFDLSGIGGDLSAPVEISLKRGGSAVSVGQLHIGALPLTFGEEGAPGSTLLTRECTGGSSQASSSSSGGGFRRYGLTTDYQLFTFAPTALETHLKNHHTGVLARFAAKPPAGVSAYLAPTRHGYRSPIMRLGTDAALQMLDVLQVKAIATGYFNLSAKVDSATADLDADFIVLMPAASYGRIDVSGEYLAVSQPVIFYDNVDPDSPAAYVMQTLVGNNQVDSYRPTSGPGITLVPGRYHRIVMAWTDADGNCPIDDYFDVQLSYYPRRRTL
jgi:hypothetical protein